MTPEEMKQASRGFSTDMSGEAVARRIDMVSRLRELGLALRKATIIGPAQGSPTLAAPPATSPHPPDPRSP